jgi:hypothetical protein
LIEAGDIPRTLAHSSSVRMSRSKSRTPTTIVTQRCDAGPTWTLACSTSETAVGTGSLGTVGRRI